MSIQIEDTSKDTNKSYSAQISHVVEDFLPQCQSGEELNGYIAFKKGDIVHVFYEGEHSDKAGWSSPVCKRTRSTMMPSHKQQCCCPCSAFFRVPAQHPEPGEWPITWISCAIFHRQWMVKNSCKSDLPTLSCTLTVDACRHILNIVLPLQSIQQQQQQQQQTLILELKVVACLLCVGQGGSLCNSMLGAGTFCNSMQRSWDSV